MQKPIKFGINMELNGNHPTITTRATGATRAWHHGAPFVDLLELVHTTPITNSYKLVLFKLSWFSSKNN
jgi:hypothetical protein